MKNRQIRDFLSGKTIAVAGVSRHRPQQPGNLIYRKLRQAGYHVFALNPSAHEVEGDRCFANLASLPAPVDGIVIATAPVDTESIVHQSACHGVSCVWMHRSFGTGSVSRDAVRYCRDHGIGVIEGGCPLMYVEPVDFGHRCMRWLGRLTGHGPR